MKPQISKRKGKKEISLIILPSRDNKYAFQTFLNAWI